jgi:replicative DNA helicase
MNTNTDSAIAPPLPHNPEAERAILAAILTGHKSAETVLDRLRSDDFYLAQNRKIFEALKSQDEAKKPTDELSIYEALSQSGQFEAAGGIAYLAEITKDSRPGIRTQAS